MFSFASTVPRQRNLIASVRLCDQRSFALTLRRAANTFVVALFAFREQKPNWIQFYEVFFKSVTVRGDTFII